MLERSRLLVFVSLFSLLTVTTMAQDGPWWVISHMSNSIESVRWAASAGANGVEADLRFDADGTPATFKHGSPCDCSCLINYGVCQHLGPNPCEAATEARTLLNAMARARPALGLVVVDSKVDAKTHKSAGISVVKLLDDALFGAGYDGNVIISAPRLDSLGYLQTAASAATTSPNASRIFFTIDGETSDTAGVLRALQKLPTPQIVYGTGLSACSPAQYYDQILLGALNQRAGAVGLNYIWTIDRSDTASRYLRKGATGIMTNDTAVMVTHLIAGGFRLAPPGTRLAPATTRNLITTLPRCDCDYHPGGCRISYAPPINWACDCSYKGAWTCGGEVVICQDPNAPACKKPTTSFDTCAQGRGDCQGYQDFKCDCDYGKGGCRISKPSPPNTACHCDYKGAWTCGGRIVPCKDPDSAACKNPSKDLASCRQGKGDCGAY